MKKFTTSILVLLISFISNSALAQTPEQAYGWQLMTPQEQIEHRQKMQSLKTAEEREAFRLEHHKLMQERAKERGVTIPDQPLQQNRGMGKGQGMGAGGMNREGMGGGKR